MGKPKPPKPSKKQPNQPKEEEKEIPKWPPLRPSPPKAHTLSLTPLLPSHIYTTTGLLPAPLCKAYVTFLSSLQLSTTPVQRGKDYAARVNDRFQVWDPGFARVLWEGTALRELVLSFLQSEEGEGEDGDGGRNIWDGVPIGLNPNIRVYRYSTGQFFAKHYDDSNTLTLPPSAKKYHTTWTLLIYLSTCTGGETVFYPEATRENRSPEPVSVAPRVGMALLHRHGESCLLHEGREVTGGEKWVLRSDLVVS
ncbi:uncharacterized protein BDW47DRAFT_123408 [Aspergillus candidus]|uniref:Fe2OG dioxygenase domain-containing protein n=1 Tax=Aspergillus candidus TaxID=41067 RepID=A0A2I2FJT7_ASPCN|nr:hypothetical protein BDW47DRAFT_123408 [Aspergillus candidus]PLB40883.1 hypothetical protein BDW47DRAFT_123408 [Aspergillus candidus]